NSSMSRLLAWLGLIALAAAAHVFDSTPLRASCLPALLVVLAFGSGALRWTLFGLAAAVALPIAFGFGEAALDLTPALIAALIGWLFARTLLPGRTALIARLMGAIDGAAPLQDAAIARYARHLTLVWAIYQAALALVALLLAWYAWRLPTASGGWPGPRLFGIVLLPLAVAALLLGEFAL